MYGIGEIETMGQFKLPPPTAPPSGYELPTPTPSPNGNDYGGVENGEDVPPTTPGYPSPNQLIEQFKALPPMTKIIVIGLAARAFRII